LENQPLCSWWQIPIHPCFWSAINCPTPWLLPLPPFHTPQFRLHYLHRRHQQLQLSLSGTSRVQWFFKLTMLHVVLDWQKISKTILEKAFFFILWCFYLFSIFVLINFKIGSSERWKFFFLK
jgi:hypothetical protein